MTHIDQYVSALASGDAEAVAMALHEDVRLHVAVHMQPFEGRDALRVVFGLSSMASSPTSGRSSRSPTETIGVVTFDVDVAGFDGNPEGLNLIRLGEGGRLEDVTVLLHPLGAIEALSREMGLRFGGPRPG